MHQYILTCLSLFCTPSLSMLIYTPLSFKNMYVSSITTNLLFFNEQSIFNSTMAFAGCNDYHGNKVLDCSVYLVYPTSYTTAEHKKCPSKYFPEKGKVVDKLLVLKPLYDARVLFKWLVLDNSSPFKQPFAVMRVMNMDTCDFKDTKVPIGENPYFHKPTIAVYDKSFDVFFRNKKLCGDMMCGETLNIDGDVINGPVPSYLPADNFKKPAFLCPLQFGSPAKGHFLVAGKFFMVSSASGKVKELMHFPPKVENLAFSCDNELLGICWIEAANETHVNCRQFNSQGELVINVRVDLESRLGSYMSMKNTVNGGLVLLTNQCEDDDWCDEHLDEVVFMVHEIGDNDTWMKLYEVENIYCDSSLDVALQEKQNGDICVTFGCVSGSYTPQTNVDVRTTIFCVGMRSISDGVVSEVNAEPVADAEEEEEEEVKVTTPRATKPTKKKGPKWHV